MEDHKELKSESEGVTGKKSASANADTVLDERQVRLNELLDRYCVDCKDDRINRHINSCNEYQCITAIEEVDKKKNCRSSESVIEDLQKANQDLCSIVHLVPDIVRKRIIEYASFQPVEAGDCNNRDIADYNNLKKNPMWLILSTAAYLKETGDWTILTEEVAFPERGKKTGTLFSLLEKSFLFNVKLEENYCLRLDKVTAEEACNEHQKKCCKSENSYKISGLWEYKTAKSVNWITLFKIAGKEYVNILEQLGKKEDAVAAKNYIEVVSGALKKNCSDEYGAISGYPAGYTENTGALYYNNSWSTDVSGRSFITISQFILGIRPDFYGLIIDPCIPSEWNEFSVKRMFRGLLYIINVKNPLHVSKGIKAMNIDGVAIKGNVIPAFTDGKTHVVEAIME